MFSPSSQNALVYSRRSSSTVIRANRPLSSITCFKKDHPKKRLEKSRGANLSRLCQSSPKAPSPHGNCSRQNRVLHPPDSIDPVHPRWGTIHGILSETSRPSKPPTPWSLFLPRFCHIRGPCFEHNLLTFSDPPRISVYILRRRKPPPPRLLVRRSISRAFGPPAFLVP